MAESETVTSPESSVDALGPWFHNLHLPDGTQTAPGHRFGDFPRNKWLAIARDIPEDLSGWKALDVGCNAGFYSFELARRGADVTAIDHDDTYLRQARWAAKQMGLDSNVRFLKKQIYDLARDDAAYDLIWFMGVFYHLRYPLLALDLLARKTKRMMVFQTMTLPGEEVIVPPPDLDITEREKMLASGWPMMAFIERRLANDPTNWWAANHSCVEAMLRSSGLKVVKRPGHEIYICHPEESDPEGMKELNDQQYRAAVGAESKLDR